MPDLVETEVLILGGGLAGLTAGDVLEHRATVLEALDRPGGLVRTERVGDFWFDRVIHLLYFSHPAVEEYVRGVLGTDLQPCPPTAWVETAAGTVRFPVQLHLAGLEAQARDRCVADLMAAHRHAESGSVPTDYEQVLLDAFGAELCELFFFPYNRKLWRRPLRQLSADGFHWNLMRPGIAEVLRGADPEQPPTAAYNSRGWYPRKAESGHRGMEVLSIALADRVADLRLRHRVERIDPESRIVWARNPVGLTGFRYRHCVSTLPLPNTLAACSTAPADLISQCESLPRNRVRSVAVAIEGGRPADTGHWRYYTREDVPFTRLVFMTEFDAAMAPPLGWGVLAEVVEPSETAGPTDAELTAQVVRGLRAVGLLDAGEVVATRVFTSDPAYVVFTDASRAVAARAIELLDCFGITTLGRYGEWTYSSMSQVIESALTWSQRYLERRNTPC
ncbi:FAD-dependent oxidoreductase [Nocardia sp. R6R-6]|uniref:FAD-dependent oxidoreductase n=1 Tax=Nocardia sp. R6R-6 TaxID=3459303 RepID=UPI00403D742C